MTAKARWEANKVLPVWTAEVGDVGLCVRRHGRRRFGWSVAHGYKIESGIGDVSGYARSFREAQKMAEAAMALIEHDFGVSK